MGIFLALFKLIFFAAWLWFCLVYFTQDHSYGWKEMILWVGVALILTIPAKILQAMLEETATAQPGVMNWLVTLANILIVYLFFYFLLYFRFHVYEPGKRVKIVGMHLIGVIILESSLALVGA